ncbi:DUF4389 domain-containing protein [Marinomonas sp. C2222]|uniref:DUF4389 domain-containing protein n=1 Tax=Marinomonas sargassi TaxID=2984494 RepID=A0ABT2YSH6_9GAMM|nr:DUF4389 domain-containing protein [Marinomonas sargassi]MCV2402710.1 DUF4389 domain-containing protein [Marinomonas sargassi]
MSKPGYSDQGFWFRLVFMLIYWLILNVSLTVFGILLLIVTAFKFASKEQPETLACWLTSVTAYIKQIVSFLSFEEEEKPFPFQPWPEAKADEQN